MEKDDLIVWIMTALIAIVIVLLAIFVHLWWTLGIFVAITLGAMWYLGRRWMFGLLWPLYISIGIMRVLGDDKTSW